MQFPQVMVPVPQPGGTVTEMPTAETSLADAAAQNINDPSMFTAAYNDPEYASPDAFTNNLIQYAQSLCMAPWSQYTCIGFDPVARGTYYAQQVFAALKGMIGGDGRSYYDQWISKPPALPVEYTSPAPVNIPSGTVTGNTSVGQQVPNVAPLGSGISLISSIEQALPQGTVAGFPVWEVGLGVLGLFLIMGMMKGK